MTWSLPAANAVTLDFEGLEFTVIDRGGSIIPHPPSVLIDEFLPYGVIFGESGVSAGVAVVREDAFAPSSGVNSVVGLNAKGVIPGKGAGSVAVGDIHFRFVVPGTTEPTATEFVTFTIGAALFTPGGAYGENVSRVTRTTFETHVHF